MIGRCLWTLIPVLTALVGCTTDPVPDGPEALITDPELAELVEIIACKPSQEHDLSYVQVFADPATAALYDTCVLQQNCTELFPAGSIFVKREYNFPDCLDEDLNGFTVSLKLEPGESPDGRDWHWQALGRDLTVTEDGAPKSCVNCHEASCAPPAGYDLRCPPD